MEDQSGRTLNCTLWEAYATQLLSFLEERESGHGHVVIVLTLAKIKDSKGKYPVAIQNSMYGSKLLINENIVEIQQYKNSLDSNHDCDSYSQRLTQMSSCSQISSTDRFLQNSQIKSITEINELKQECYCITVAEIDKIFPRNGWSYEGCSKCNRKVDPLTLSDIRPGCGKDNSQTITRVEVKVSHKNESAKFILWDRECMQLINQTALDLKKRLISEGELDPMAVPEDVDNILKKVLAFKIKVQPSYKRSSVVMLSEDAQLIESILEKILTDEDTSTLENGKSISSEHKEHDSCDSFDHHASKEFTSAQLSSTRLTKNIKTE